jgi:hypothetical protein
MSKKNGVMTGHYPETLRRGADRFERLWQRQEEKRRKREAGADRRKKIEGERSVAR